MHVRNPYFITEPARCINAHCMWTCCYFISLLIAVHMQAKHARMRFSEDSPGVGMGYGGGEEERVEEVHGEGEDGVEEWGGWGEDGGE
jgi:hypothetical protein